MAWVKVGEHLYMDGGYEGVAARLGITVEELKRRYEADKNARGTRMAGGHSGRSDTEYHNNARAGIRYGP